MPLAVHPARAAGRAPLLLAGLAALLAGCADAVPTGPVESAPVEDSRGTPAAPSSPAAPESPKVTAPTPNPMRGASLWVDPSSDARKTVNAWRSSRPADAAQLEKIASQPQAVWFGDWNPQPYQWVQQVTGTIAASGAIPVYVLYNIPLRDCGLYSAGGAASAAAYQQWISEVVRGIGSRRAVVVLEPDAVAAIDCLSASNQAARLAMLKQAVRTLKAGGNLSVYIDAGNAKWHPAVLIAGRLEQAGIAEADGFALNVSNFVATDDNVRYGTALSSLVGGKHFVIDTSRNGLGPAEPYEWCNAAGRAIGRRPTTETGNPLVDAFLWIKTPGESDGECNGGPAAGVWWPEYALGLAKRAN